MKRPPASPEPRRNLIMLAGVVAIFVILLLWRRRIWTAVFLALAEVCGSGCSQIIKHLVQRPRPPHPLVRADFGSFPSGHAITTTVVGLTLVAAMVRPGRRTIPLAGVALAVVTIMFCRTYLRAHWLSDTFEGVLVGAGIALLLWALFTPVLLRERTPVLLRQRTPVLLREQNPGPAQRGAHP